MYNIDLKINKRIKKNIKRQQQKIDSINAHCTSYEWENILPIRSKIQNRGMNLVEKYVFMLILHKTSCLKLYGLDVYCRALNGLHSGGTACKK